MIDGWKNRGLTPDKVPAGEGRGLCQRQGRELYAAYQERLKALNAVDFGDLLLERLRLFREQRRTCWPTISRRFHYMLVDEYQDTNVAQYLWLRLLAQGHRNICCVGDDDQSIYGWRGAEVDNILRFEKDFPGARRHPAGAQLPLDRRISSAPPPASSPTTRAASARRCAPTTNDGDKVKVRGRWDGEEEARAVGEDIEQAPARRAIARRDRHPGARLLPDARLRGPLHHARPALPRHRRPALLRARGNPRRDGLSPGHLLSPTNDLAFERIVNVPKRGLGDSDACR